MTFNLKDLEQNQITKPRSLAWKNWKKFEKIGDSIEGFIVDVFYKKETPDYDDGRGITLKQEDGSLINLSIKTYDFVLKETDHLRIGDPLKAKFTSLGEKKPGKFQAKLFTYYGVNLPENAGNPTVKELYEADKNVGGSVAPEGEVVANKPKEDIMPETGPEVDENGAPKI